MEFPKPHSDGQTIIQDLGIGGVYLFAISTLLSISGANLALSAIILSFLMSFRFWWPILRHERIFQFSVCFFLLLALRTLWAMWEFPQLTDRHIDGFWDWLYLGFFIPTAWPFKGKSRRVYAALYLMFGGLMLHIFYETSWAQLENAIKGVRSGLGMQIPLTGLFSCTALLGVSLLAPRIWGPIEKKPFFFFRVAGWFVILVFFLEVLFVSQSITSWIAGILVTPTLVWIRVHRRFKFVRSKFRAAGLALAILLFAAIALLTIKNADTIQNRISSQMEVMRAISTLDFDRIPFTAGIGMRLWTYRYGFDKWLEKPILGWGTGVEVAKLPERPPNSLDHMHSTYLEILTRFGIVGLIFFGAGIWLFVVSLRNAFHLGRIPFDLFLFFIGALCILLVWSAGNFRLPTYLRCHYILLGGLAYSFCLSPESKENEGSR